MMFRNSDQCGRIFSKLVSFCFSVCFRIYGVGPVLELILKTWRLVASWAPPKSAFFVVCESCRFLVWLSGSGSDLSSMNPKSFQDYDRWIKTERVPLSGISFMMSTGSSIFLVFIFQGIASRMRFHCIFDVGRGSRLLNSLVLHTTWVAWRNYLLRDKEMAIRCFWVGGKQFSIICPFFWIFFLRP